MDDQGREFSNSSKAQIALHVSDKDSKLLFEKLNPGLSQTGKIIFDVPKDAEGLILKARDGMTGKEIKLKVE
ncbi:hypothetical protein COK98_02730 [Bacillus cereus]|uniref:DUF4352 domain-containing protein n=1 Tax=Bacillus cereus TaxID=1396 RepID=A0A9X7GA51_BACCE|nr:hypothetical protein CON26_20965 [Bacillus cereus]PFV11306.1 hypothetical protein COK98_02730 [Bacillus cereus]